MGSSSAIAERATRSVWLDETWAKHAAAAAHDAAATDDATTADAANADGWWSRSVRMDEAGARCWAGTICAAIRISSAKSKLESRAANAAANDATTADAAVLGTSSEQRSVSDAAAASTGFSARWAARRRGQPELFSTTAANAPAGPIQQPHDEPANVW